MDWTTLISVVIGGLIATVPILINNRFQAREREKEREEARKEAKVQLALELMRNDVKIMQDAIDNQLRSLEVVLEAKTKVSWGRLSEDEVIEELKLAILDEKSKMHQLGELDVIAEKLAFTLGDEFYSEFRNFCQLCSEYWSALLNSAYFPIDNEELARVNVMGSAAKIHTMMREKLISTRDN